MGVLLSTGNFCRHRYGAALLNAPPSGLIFSVIGFLARRNIMSDYYDLGSYTRPVTTTSKDAQLWFDRGLIWCYGYNHDEAVRCFKKAAKHDPNCAMARVPITTSNGWPSISLI
jgi:hypothetical protein